VIAGPEIAKPRTGVPVTGHRRSDPDYESNVWPPDFDSYEALCFDWAWTQGRAAFLCADLDLTLEPREDHAAYIANWLQMLKADNCAIFTAASHAQRAADFINGLQPAASAG
jgi:hypothetical protein